MFEMTVNDFFLTMAAVLMLLGVITFRDRGVYHCRQGGLRRCSLAGNADS